MPILSATWEAEVGELWAQGQPGQHSKKPFQKKKKEKKRRKRRRKKRKKRRKPSVVAVTIILALGRCRWEDFKANLGYTRPCFKKKRAEHSGTCLYSELLERPLSAEASPGKGSRDPI
jgi:hypothetical protein